MYTDTEGRVVLLDLLSDGRCRRWRERRSDGSDDADADTDEAAGGEPDDGDTRALLKAWGLDDDESAAVLAAVAAGRAWRFDDPVREPGSSPSGWTLRSLAPLHRPDAASPPTQPATLWLAALRRSMATAVADGVAEHGPLRVQLTIDAELRVLACAASGVDHAAARAWLPAGAALDAALRPAALATLRALLARTGPTAGTIGPGPAPWIAWARPDGGCRWLAIDELRRTDVDGGPAPDRAAPCWRLGLVEVTARARRTQLQRIHEQALHLSGLAVAVVDALHPLRPLVEVSPAFCALTGYEQGQLLGRSARFLTGLSGHQEGGTKLSRALQDGRAEEASLLLYRPDRSRWWARFALTPVACAASGEVSHLLCALTDVSESRELIGQLTTQTAMLEAVHHDNPNGLLAFDAEGLACLQNYAFKRITGLYAVGMPRHKVMVQLAQSYGMQAEQLQSALARDGAVQCRLPAPSLRVIDISTAQRDGAGQARLLILRDVTAEAHFNEMQLQFLSMAAHEIRTPMASIQGFSGLMLTGAVPEAMHRELIERIHRQSERLGQMINDLLDLSRIEGSTAPVAELESLRVGPVVTEVVEGLQQGRGRIVVAGDALGATVRTLRASLVQILVNLLGNALKYSADTVTVRVQWGGPSGDVLEIAVEDRGIGMSPQVQARLFTKFFRADPHGKVHGTGLGLSIARALADRIGALIGVRSQPGQGSVFTLQLPPDARLPPAAPHPVPPTPARA